MDEHSVDVIDMCILTGWVPEVPAFLVKELPKFEEVKPIYRYLKDQIGDLSEIPSKVVGLDKTLVIVTTPNGRKFGGYAHAKWKNKGRWTADPKAFIFSVDEQTVFGVKHLERALLLRSCDISFGEDIIIYY